MDTTTAKRAYRFRFYPTPEQEQTLRRTLGCCRKVYNMALEARSEAWTVRHESVSYEDTSRMLTDWKKTKEYAYLREVSSVPLQQSLRHLQAAYRNFFAKTGDYPRFKSKKNGGAATYAASAFTWDIDLQQFLPCHPRMKTRQGPAPRCLIRCLVIVSEQPIITAGSIPFDDPSPTGL